MGEVNREEQVGIKYRYDRRTGQEKIVIPSEWLQTNNASTEFERERIKVLMKKRVEEKIFVIELNNAKILMQKKNRRIESYRHKLKRTGGKAAP